MAQEQQEIPPMARNVSLIVVTAFVFSVVIYVAICFLVESGQRSTPNFVPLVPSQISRQVIPVVAFVALLAASAWIKFFAANRIGDSTQTVGLDEP